MFDLPVELSINHVFNVSDMSLYHDTFSLPIVPSLISITSTRVPRAPSVGSIRNDINVDIIYDEFVTRSDGGFQRFLVCWNDCSSTDNTRLNEDELR